jgi:nucleoside-diphosphate-sugar epimerase
VRILVTGGAGYIGSVLTPALLAKGHEVTVLDNFMYHQSSLMDCCHFEKFQVVRGDCRDETVLRGLVAKADVVIPLAALVGAPVCQRDPVGAQTTNLEAIRLLLSLRSPEQHILFPNSNSGYGIGEPGKFCTEETPLRPLTLYGRTKVEAEKAILDARNAITFRLATVFGLSPRMRLDLLVNDFVYRAITDHAVVVFQGHFKRNYIHVRDVARAFLHGLENFETMKITLCRTGCANLSSSNCVPRSKKQVPKLVYVEAPIGEDPDKRDYIVSNAVVCNGFSPEWPLQGIKN